MKRILFTLCTFLACGHLNGQANAWQPSLGHRQIPIWAGPIPDSVPAVAPESAISSDGLIAGKPVLVVSNVSEPTLTVYSPKGTNTGVSVVVFPGGGYKVLAIDLEGTEVCDWLNSIGITAVLPKYRVPTPKVGNYYESVQALQDAQRTLSLVRFHATAWHIDPHKIGVIGFSAGGHMVTTTSTVLTSVRIPRSMRSIKRVAVRISRSRFTPDISGMNISRPLI